MIYELNGRVHFELEPDVMRKLVATVDEELNELGTDPKHLKLSIGLCNFRSALQNELDRATPASPPPLVASSSSWD